LGAPQIIKEGLKLSLILLAITLIYEKISLAGLVEDRHLNVVKNLANFALPQVLREVTPVEIGSAADSSRFYREESTSTRSMKQEVCSGHLSMKHGTVGPMTVTMLMWNTIKAAETQTGVKAE